MRRLLLFVFLLIPALAAAVDTPTYQKTITYQLHFRLNSRWVNGDSADVVSAYPSSEDTTGKRLELTWIGGDYNEWDFVPDSTDAYDFYARSSASLSDTLLPEVSGRLWWANDVPEGLIASTRAFLAGTVPATALADGAALANLISSAADSAVGLRGGIIGSDSLKVVSDSIEANIVSALSALYVQPGVPPTPSNATFQADDAVVAVRNVPLDADSVYAATAITTAGNVKAVQVNITSTFNSTSVLGTSQFDGSLQIGNDLIVDDDATVTGGLTASTTADVADSLQAGSSFGSMGFSADSTSAALVLGGWLVVDEVHIGAATITSGNTSVTYNMPGARSWDTFVIPAFDGNATSTIGSNALFVWDIPSDGKITFTRGGTTGDLQIKFIVVKYR